MSEAGWNYSERVKDHFMNPRNILEGDENEYKADGIGFVGSPACGDMMKIFIKVEDDRIVDLKWKTFGCASAIGSTSMLSEMVLEKGGMKLDEAYKITPEDVIKALGGLPSNKIHCSVLGDKALQGAIRDYYEKSGQKDKLPDEETSPIVCECLNISEEDIRMEVLEGVQTFTALQERTKISTGCGKCKEKTQELLDKFVKKYYSEDVYTGAAS